MTEIEDFIQAEFVKLVPYQPLSGPEIAAIKLAVKRWLDKKREDLFIDTVSTMDCEMSAIREETFEALLQEIF